MENKKFWLGILVLVLLFGMTVVGCDNGTTNGGNDTWSNVTSLSQVNGSWKAPSSYSGTMQGTNITVYFNNYIVTFNATAQTISVSGSSTSFYSGADINTF